MIRQFVFKGIDKHNLIISEDDAVNTFWIKIGDNFSVLTKSDAREIAKVLGTSYSSYGESIRFKPDPESEDMDLSDIDV